MTATRKRRAFSKKAGVFDLRQYLEQRRLEVDRRLQHCLPPARRFPGRLFSAMRHSLFSGGKRLRPILVLAAAEACGRPRRAVMPAACALECLHTYSLIHDDLPAMDDDDLRRGQPTCHIVFGEGAAILAGDALLTLAFELLASDEQVKLAGRSGANRVVQAVKILAASSGLAGMVGGQMADLEAEGREVSLPQLQYIHTHKTGRLFQASLLIGGVLAGASRPQLRALSEYGETVGLAFQIVDDILDVVGEKDRLGKNTGSDRSAGKATYPALFGLDESRQEAGRLIARGCRVLRPLGEAGRPLRVLAEFVLKREV